MEDRSDPAGLELGDPPPTGCEVRECRDLTCPHAHSSWDNAWLLQVLHIALWALVSMTSLMSLKKKKRKERKGEKRKEKRREKGKRRKKEKEKGESEILEPEWVPQSQPSPPTSGPQIKARAV